MSGAPAPAPVLDRQEAAAIVQGWRGRGLRIVFTNGCFDLLHAGHVHYLFAARALGDRLVVGINTDDSVRRLKGASRPLQPLQDRARVLAALRCVDLVVPFAEDTPRALIERFVPDVLVKGADYRPEEIVGADVVRAAGGEVRTIPLLPGRSTTDLVARAASR